MGRALRRRVCFCSLHLTYLLRFGPGFLFILALLFGLFFLSVFFFVFFLITFFFHCSNGQRRIVYKVGGAGPSLFFLCVHSREEGPCFAFSVLFVFLVLAWTALRHVEFFSVVCCEVSQKASGHGAVFSCVRGRPPGPGRRAVVRRLLRPRGRPAGRGAATSFVLTGPKRVPCSPTHFPPAGGRWGGRGRVCSARLGCARTQCPDVLHWVFFFFWLRAPGVWAWRSVCLCATACVYSISGTRLCVLLLSSAVVV